MPIDYSKLTFGKGTPIAAEKAKRLRDRQSIDERESEKVKARSGGQCEVWMQGVPRVFWRCHRRASQVHHMIGGGLRAKGESAKAIRKQHCCEPCHSAITGHRIQRIGSAVPHWQDRYRRVA